MTRVESAASSRIALQWLLFFATLATTTLHKALPTGGDWGQKLTTGLLFSVPLCLILMAHEMGHYVAARRYGVDVTWPYFIPLPPILGVGTFGAFIRIRSAIPSRAALLDIGIAGPLAGLVVALPILVIGLLKSQVITNDLTLPVEVEGQNLLYGLIKLAIFGEWLPGPGGLRDVNLHPFAHAGWFGLLLTMINLIPIAQLDGGHILYALIGERHHRVTDWLHGGLFALGLGLVAASVAASFRAGPSKALLQALNGGGFMWLVFGGVLMVLRRIGDPYHPPIGRDADDAPLLDPAADRPLDPWRRRLAIFAMILLVLLFMPTPWRRIGG